MGTLIQTTWAIMQSIAVVALALLESASAFTAPAAAMRSVSRASATMFSEGDLGVLPPLGVFDPLGLIETRDMRRYEIMEIKHGRAAMLGFLHVIAIEAGVRVPGYLSTSQNLKFSDVPAGCFASLEAVPTAGWLQIMVLTCMQEAGTGFASKPQTDDAEAGDIALDSWVRYDDPEVKAFKLNAERQNGRRPCSASPAASSTSCSALTRSTPPAAWAAPRPRPSSKRLPSLGNAAWRRPLADCP